VYFHGGGWTFGKPEHGESYFAPLVKDLGLTVLSVDYRLAPENKWPVAVHDGIDALNWVR
jgi:acetyl esterase